MLSPRGPSSIPVLEGIRRSFSHVTAVAMLGAAAWPLVAVAWYGTRAFELTPYLPWSADAFPRPVNLLVVPSLVALPLIAVAHARARRGRMLAAGRWFAWSLAAFSLLKVVPNGVFSPGWFLQPLLVVLTAVAFGAGHGLAMAGLAASAMALTARAQAAVDATVIQFATPVVGILLVGGVLGSLLHRAMQGLFAVETEQRDRIEQTLRALRQRERLLRHAMRVATIGELASMVVHQLRNKFQLIHGHVALGLIAEATEKDRRLREIQTSVQAASAVVEQLLHLAHPAETVHHVVDLAVECRSFAERVRPLLPASIRLETLIPNGSVHVALAPDELGDALLNLVINAKQAMRQGTIKIATGSRDDASAFVTVSDDGPGIDERVRARLFSPFVTTKTRGHGTGLGLASVDRFVRTAGGHIDVDTGPDRGTTFHLVFPRAPAGDTRVKVG